jgi:AcrR family transcriptional regulator
VVLITEAVVMVGPCPGWKGWVSPAPKLRKSPLPDGPALYRYFASRDDLLTELVLDAYHDFGAALAAGTRPQRKLDPTQRLRAFAAAYRDWANTEPHRYRLLFAAPLPGYDPQASDLIEASKEAMAVLLDVLAPLLADTRSASASTAAASADIARLNEQLAQWSSSREFADIPPALALKAVTTWSRLHGLASLEIEGTYISMGIDADLLYDAEVTAILTSLGHT